MSSLTFGKYAGEDQLSIAQLDPQYIMWAYDNPNYTKEITPEAYAKAVRVMEEYADTQDDDIPWLDTAGYGLGGDR